MIASTHRAHGHTLARGTHPNEVMAELYGKLEGCSHGYGGSMHLYDVERGNLGANAVVGGGLPAIAGAGARVQAARRAARRGRVLRRRRDEHRHLPRVAQPRAAVAGARGLRLREQPLGRVDAGAAALADLGGHDQARASPSACARSRSTARTSRTSTTPRSAALEHARSGKGPVFLVAETYRLHGHYIGDPQVYRSKDEIADVRATHDPIEHAARAGSSSPTRTSRRSTREVHGDRRGARSSSRRTAPTRQPEDALKNVYA